MDYRFTYDEFRELNGGDNGHDIAVFEYFSKKNADKLAGRRIKHGEYKWLMHDIEEWIATELDRYEIISLGEHGPYTHGGDGFLSKPLLKDCIDRLQEYYDNYDKYFNDFVTFYADNFAEGCKRLGAPDRIEARDDRHQEVIDKNLKHNGYIYVMYNCGYYKIGRTLDCSRLGEYTKLPEEPVYTILEYVKDYVSAETMLHRRFESKRLREGSCEWFALDEDDLAEISKLLSEIKTEPEEISKYYRRYILKESV